MISTVCFGQEESQMLIGKWKYINTTNLQDSILESSVNEFELEIISDGTFEMTGEKISVSGTWKLEDSVLLLNGKRKGERNSKIQKMPIYKISESKLSIEFITEEYYPEKSLMIFSKMK
jgi:hypothetical protein